MLFATSLETARQTHSSPPYVTTTHGDSHDTPQVHPTTTSLQPSPASCVYASSMCPVSVQRPSYMRFIWVQRPAYMRVQCVLNNLCMCIVNASCLGPTICVYASCLGPTTCVYALSMRFILVERPAYMRHQCVLNNLRVCLVNTS